MKNLSAKMFSVFLALLIGGLPSCTPYYPGSRFTWDGQPIKRDYLEESDPPPRRSNDSGTDAMKTIAVIGLACLVLPFVVEALAGEGLVAEEVVAARVATGAAADAEAGMAAGAGTVSSGNAIYKIGTLEDTTAGWSWGQKRLNIPNWTLRKNDQYMQKIIDGRHRVYVASPEKPSTLLNETREPTVFSRELEQLRSAGYHREGNFLVPPSNN